MQLKILGIQGATSIDLVRSATVKMATADLAATLAKTGLTSEEQKQILIERGLTAAEAEIAVATHAHSAANVVAAGTTGALTGATTGLGTALKGLKAAFLSNPITAIITVALSLITVISTVVSKIKQGAEEAKQATIDSARAIKESFDTAINDISNNVDTLKGLTSEFNKLSQGVDDYGNNISLAGDEYERYREIVQTIVGMSPKVVDGFDKEGNAIVNKNGLIEQTIALLEEQQRLEKEKLVTDSNLKTLFGNSKFDIEDAWNAIDEMPMPAELSFSGVKIDDNGEKQYGFINQIPEYVEKAIHVGFDKWNDGGSLNYIAKNIDEVYAHLDEILAFAGQDFVDENGNRWAAMSDSQIQSFKSLILDIKSYTAKAKEASGEFNEYLQMIPQSMTQYSNLNAPTQNFLSDWISKSFNIDKDTTEADIKVYSDKIRNFASKLANDTNLQGIISDSLSLKNKGKDVKSLTVKEYQKQISDVINQINSIEDEDTKLNIQSVIDTDSLEQDINSKISRVKNILKDNFDSKVEGMSVEELDIAYNIHADTNSLTFDELQDQIADKKALSFEVDVSVEAEGIENFNKAMSESASATGLTTESVANLKSRYQELENFDAEKLFERTTSGIHLNQKALEELEDAYVKQNTDGLKDKLEALKDEYNDLTYQMDTCGDAAERATLYAKRDNVLSQIHDTANLISQYDALTSSYNKWIAAQSQTDERDMYSNLGEGYDKVKELLDAGWYNDSEVNTYLDTLLGKRTDDNVADFKRLTEKIKGTKFSIADFFQYDEDNKLVSDGLFNFMDTVKEKLGDEFVQIAEDGAYSWDFTGEKIEKVAEALGMSTEAVEILEKAFGDITENTNLKSFLDNFDGLQEGMSDRVTALKKALGDSAKNYNLDSFNFGSFDTTDIESQIDNISAVIDDKFKGKDGVIDLSVEGAEEALSILLSLVARKQELDNNNRVVMSVDTSKLSGDVQGAITQVQSLQSAFDSLEQYKIAGADTSEAQEKIREVANTLKTLPKETKTKLGLNTKEAKEALDTITSEEVVIDGKLNIPDTAISTLQAAINGMDTDILVKAGVDESAIIGYNPEDKNANVTYILHSEEVDAYNPKDHNRTVTYSLVKSSGLENFNPQDISRTVTYHIKTKGTAPKGEGEAQGTAFVQGNWGTKGAGIALGGEIGRKQFASLYSDI